MAYSEAQKRATMKYQKKAYKQINIRFRYDTDADLIDSMENATDNGIALREWVRNLFYYGGKPKEVIPDGLVKSEDVEKVLLAHRIDIRTVKAIMDELK